MRRSIPFTRVLLSAACLCAAMVFASHQPQQLRGADSSGDKSSETNPITAPNLVDVTDRVEVTVPSTLRVVGRNEYKVGVSIKNVSDEPLGGAILLVVRRVEPEGLTAPDVDSRSDDGMFFELIDSQGSLAPDSKTRPKNIVFESEEPLGPRDRRLLKLDIRVVQRTATNPDAADRRTDDEKPTAKRPADRLNPMRDSTPSSSGIQPNGPAAGSEVRLDPTDKNIERVIQVQDKWTDRLMKKEGVVGTATGLDRDGKLTVQVFAVNAGVKGLPKNVDGIPLKQMVTGAIHARWQSTEPTNPKKRFERPVPIGVSTGSAAGGTGTISCRLRSEDGTLYSLSNNHVTSRTNRGRVGDRIVQPGRGDSGGKFYPDNVIGTLADFVEIKFGPHKNEVDAAITRVDESTQGASTPSNGYGAPTSVTRRARLGTRVQKYGRTTSLTKGRITSLNAVVYVDYGGDRIGRFVRQIVVTGDRAGFIKGGDSGSLLVTDPGRAPVGLLFAGSRGGRIAIANRIDAVLSAFDVTIDDGSTVDGRNGDSQVQQPKPPPAKPAPPRLRNPAGQVEYRKFSQGSGRTRASDR